MLQPDDPQPIDVLIAGAGFAGLSLAIALRQGLGSAFSVAVADPTLMRNNDPTLSRPALDARASAIAAAARRMFEAIGVWEEGAGGPGPIPRLEGPYSRPDPPGPPLR